ncbi:YeeE/YedE family protein [Ascidiaceihabitans sp.]|uniref:YeeE/YedE family protein n=1 Tax=Ascidiaceihabitans sp. TaxID=1872644 RepID=UPI003299F2F9
MLLENLPFDLPVQSVHVIFGLVLGLVFGVAAQISKFCLRRAVAGDTGADASAGAVWIMALAAAIGGFAVTQSLGWVALEDHRLLSSSAPVLAIIVGGVAFGAGMVLTRGCMSRLTVLSASGNLRAFTVILVFAIVAHATLKGVFAPMRVALGAVQQDFGIASLAQIPGFAPVVAVLLAVGAIVLGRRSGTSARVLGLGAVIGGVAVAGWAGTSVWLLDDFDPLPVQSAAFTLPWADTLFWTIASSAIPAGFGTGLIAGVSLGSFASAVLRSEFALESFEAPAQTLRYGAGGALMGVGGVLAGGCTIGAGLSGSATLSVAALLALGAIITGAIVTQSLLQARGAAVLSLVPVTPENQVFAHQSLRE